MTRPVALFVAALTLAAVAVGLALTKAASADGPGNKKLAYVYISGRGATARAWYQGAPPSGTPVQDALDKFTADGYQFAAIATGGLPGQVVAGGSSLNPGDAALDAAFVVLLQR